MARPALKAVRRGKPALRLQRPANNQDPCALFSEGRWQQLAAALKLTPRQSQIARLMCDGHTYKSIALHIGISVNTVRMHMRALFAKVAMHDRLSVVLQLIAVDRGLPALT